MTQEDKNLLLKDLCTRLPYQPLCKKVDTEDVFCECDAQLGYSLRDLVDNKIIIKPYLRPMSSMTEEEAKELSILYGLKDILSIKKITDEYIEVVVDDGFCSTETGAIWYDEIISSIEIFDWLNAHHFDYRGLIPKGLAIPVTKENNPYKTLKA